MGSPRRVRLIESEGRYIYSVDVFRDGHLCEGEYVEGHVDDRHSVRIHRYRTGLGTVEVVISSYKGRPQVVTARLIAERPLSTDEVEAFLDRVVDEKCASS